jgi:hypothetical protein
MRSFNNDMRSLRNETGCCILDLRSFRNDLSCLRNEMRSLRNDMSSYNFIMSGSVIL